MGVALIIVWVFIIFVFFAITASLWATFKEEFSNLKEEGLSRIQIFDIVLGTLIVTVILFAVSKLMVK
jgi:hypothetical protein